MGDSMFSPISEALARRIEPHGPPRKSWSEFYQIKAKYIEYVSGKKQNLKMASVISEDVFGVFIPVAALKIFKKANVEFYWACREWVLAGGLANFSFDEVGALRLWPDGWRTDGGMDFDKRRNSSIKGFILIILLLCLALYSTFKSFSAAFACRYSIAALNFPFISSTAWSIFIVSALISILRDDKRQAHAQKLWLMLNPDSVNRRKSSGFWRNVGRAIRQEGWVILTSILLLGLFVFQASYNILSRWSGLPFIMFICLVSIVLIYRRYSKLRCRIDETHSLGVGLHSHLDGQEVQ